MTIGFGTRGAVHTYTFSFENEPSLFKSEFLVNTSIFKLNLLGQHGEKKPLQEKRIRVSRDKS